MKILLYSLFAITSIAQLSNASAQSLSPKIDLSLVTKSFSISQIVSQKVAESISNPLPVSILGVNTSDAIEKCSALQFKFAQLLNKNVEKITDLTLFGFIDEWWRTRYRYGGTTKSGIDCSAFTGLLMKSVYGVILPRTAREQYAASAKLSKDELVEGNLVFFNTSGGVSHVGLYLGDGYFVHSCTSKGVYINNLNESYYSKRFIGGGKPEVTGSEEVPTEQPDISEVRVIATAS